MKATNAGFCQVFVVFALHIMLLVSCAQQSNDEPTEADVISARVQALSSNAMEGRETGTPGEANASAWIDSVFQTQGLIPRGDKGSLQAFQYKPHPPMQMHGHGDSASMGMALVQEINGNNVLYALPERSNRWGIVGAHYDHLGYGDENWRSRNVSFERAIRRKKQSEVDVIRCILRRRERPLGIQSILQNSNNPIGLCRLHDQL
jgi:hypothetical protein